MGRPFTPEEIQRVRELRETTPPAPYTRIAKIIGRNEFNVRELVKRGYTLGDLGRGNRKDPPAEFLKLFPLMTCTAAAKHWGVSRNTIAAWRKRLALGQRDRGEMNRGSTRYQLRRPVPEGFAEYFAAHGYNAARSHYGAAPRTMSRWLTELGIERQRAKHRRQRAAREVMRAKLEKELFEQSIAHLSPFERQLARVRAGAQVILRPSLRPANDREYSLTGCGLAL